MLLNSFAVTFLLAGFLSITTASRRKPRCAMDSLAVENLGIKFDHKQSTKILADGNITRYLTVNWTLEGANANASKLDGYLIRLVDADVARSSVPPFQDPDASLTKLWIRTSNVTECSEPNATNAMMSSEIHCSCNASTCFFLDGLHCSLPSTSFLHYRLGVFYAIPNTRTSIMYETKYQAQYTIEIYPYYRQFLSLTANRLTLQKAWSCAEDVSVISNISVAEADTKCCEANFVTFSPLDVRTSEFMFDQQTKTLNISISWVPPTAKELMGSVLRIEAETRLEQVDVPKHTIIQSEGFYNENISCQIHNRTDSATIYNLQPNMSYTINIHTWYLSGVGRTACHLGGCSKTLEINTNLCHAGNSKCSEHAVCKFDIPTFTVSCECKPGFKGNGISTKYSYGRRKGTGCELIASTPLPANQQTTNQDDGVTATTTSQAAGIHHDVLSSILLICSITTAIAGATIFETKK